MRIALAQLNPLVGDLRGNGALILNACKEAYNKKSNLLLTPELSLWGYPPKDLLLNSLLLDQQKEILDEISSDLMMHAPTLKALIGIAEPTKDIQLPKLFNAMALVDAKGWKVIARKQLLPTYDVFDEKRYFRSANSPSILDISIDKKNWRIGITICEDLWVEEALQGQRLIGPDPIARLLLKKIDLLINLSASPFSHSKESLRQQLAAKAVQRLGCPMIYLNQVGGNDELVFDGSSFALNAKSELTLKLPNCHEALAIWDPHRTSTKETSLDTESKKKLFQALVLGVRDYAKKCGFNRALLGLSGGIDSALVAIIAAAALGVDNVTTILMPSPWNSSRSTDDALELAKRIGLSTHTVPIQSLMTTFDSALAIPLGKPPEGITAENLQSRIRGTLLMAIANQKGHLLLSTGNKSELAVGYCTLYGDMNGGLSVIGDLYKSCVFDLCKWLDNPVSKQYRESVGLPSSEEVVGKAILTKPPSAELRPGQLDSDSLPNYELLDPILKAIIEDKQTSKELIKAGHDPAIVRQVQTLIKKSEFKRRQAPPLLKVTHQAFGSGWRIPIAAT